VAKIRKEKEVAYRALCLTALVMRGKLEHGLKAPDVPNKEDVKKGFVRLTDWLSSEKLTSWLSKKEAASLAKSPGSWTQQDVIDAGWRLEALGVLLWSLSTASSIPPYDTQFDGDETMAHVLGKPAKFFLQEVRLREYEQVAKARDTAEHWHWRSRTTTIQKQGVQPPYGLTFPQIIKISADDGFKDGLNPAPIKDDFPAFGKSYAELTDEEYSIVTSIASERHFALNWLCKESRDWDKTSTDT